MQNSITEQARFQRSHRLEKSGRQWIAGFTQSMMKKPEQFAPGQFPVYLESGQGAQVTDVDGNTYIDYICGLAANTLGHNHPVVNRAITDNLHKGIIHSLPTPVEIDAAKMLADMIPGTDKVRFFKTGADANSAAVRLARHITGKEKIVTVGYNGWHDHYMFDTPGVPQALESLTYRMPLMTVAQEQPILDLLDREAGQIAAVVFSIPYNRELSREFVNQLREACQRNKILFIWDEIVSGFRLSLGGAQAYFGVQADLVTLSKGIAAGMPLSAVCGGEQFMRKMEDLQVSTTFGGEMLSLAVCVAVLNEYRQTNYIQTLAQLGHRLKTAVNEVSKEKGSPLRVVGYDPIPMFLFANNPQDHIKLAIPFLAEMARRGVLLRREVNFISAAHTEAQIDYTVEAVASSLTVMGQNGLFEEGQDQPQLAQQGV